MKYLHKSLILLLSVIYFQLVATSLLEEEKFTLDSLAHQISQEQHPALALFNIWNQNIEVNNQLTRQDSYTPLELLNSIKSCSQDVFANQFIELCHQIGIRTRLSSQQHTYALDFGYNNEWILIDLEQKQVYLTLDNHQLASSEDLMDDPFLLLRNKSSLYETEVDFKSNCIKLARFAIAEPYFIEQQSLPNELINFSECKNSSSSEHHNPSSLPSYVEITNQSQVFDTAPICFYLDKQIENEVGQIWWQISADSDFNFIPSNFDQVQTYHSPITISLISETFFNPGELYYFRVKGFAEGQWGAWSKTFAFTIEKPDAVTLVELDKKEQGFELNWEREAVDDPAIEYLVYGSNALDFIPSLYTDSQINEIVDEEITETEPNNNFIAIVKEPKIIVSGSLAYYRIIARKNGLYSVPSYLIRVYDEDLILPRTVLQLVEQNEQFLIKRVLLPTSYPSIQHFLPFISATPDIFENSLLKLYRVYKETSILPLVEVRAYQQSPYVNDQIWGYVKNYLLPENHPIKTKLDRMFSTERVILTPESFRKAGFKNYRQRRASRIMASPHPDLPDYYIKAFPDSDLVVRAEWHKFIHRIEGAKVIKTWIANNQLQSVFDVPDKWIYPLPANPSPPESSLYLRKNFILVAEKKQILSHEKNEKAYRHRMNRKMLDYIYRVFDDLGLADSIYAFNLPFCQNGKLSFIDTEHHHRWPVPFHKMQKYFSKEMQAYWQLLIDNKGPKGHVRDPNY